MKRLKFILNDENKMNQYGFRVRNSGLNVDRFRANPVILDSHQLGNRAVIGRWENIQIEGELLTAEAVFDTADENAREIAGKVERGFLRGASLGLNPYSMDNFQIAPDGTYDLVKCEVLEASIVPIPNNANAIKLYAATAEGVQQLKDADVPNILLMANEVHNYKFSTMNKIKLSALAAMAIALNADQEHEASAVDAGIMKLKADLDAANKKLEGIEQLEADKKARLAADTVEADIHAGKIDATKKDDFIKLYAESSDLYKSIMASLPAKQNLGGQIHNPDGFGEVKTMDDFEKLTLSAQLEFKTSQPDAYKRLFK
jgi:hypothetical protein